MHGSRERWGGKWGCFFEQQCFLKCNSNCSRITSVTPLLAVSAFFDGGAWDPVISSFFFTFCFIWSFCCLSEEICFDFYSSCTQLVWKKATVIITSTRIRERQHFQTFHLHKSSRSSASNQPFDSLFWAESSILAFSMQIIATSCIISSIGSKILNSLSSKT